MAMFIPQFMSSNEALVAASIALSIDIFPLIDRA
jgi:hypothetical protein